MGDIKKILASPSYIKAYKDVEFLNREELRPVRLQLELRKAELIQQDHGIESTIVVFGSARTREDHPNYQAAREFSRIVSTVCQLEGKCEYVIVTGGGPGIMEAANRGAYDVGAKSIGLNISLPFEQQPNPYITPELCFDFHYFAIRKMHFLMRARALAAFPGGFGTLDELFETLTLIQTGKSDPVPVILFGQEYWERLIDFNVLVDEGMIAAKDLDLFRYAETPEAAWKVITDFYAVK